LTFANLSRYVSHSIRHSNNCQSNKILQAKSEQQIRPAGTQVRFAATGKRQASEIVDCVAVNGGKQVDIAFADLSKYRLHSEWIKDASPSNTGPDFYRKSAADVWNLENFKVSDVEVSADRQTLSVQYQAKDGSCCTEEVKAQFLHACAPFVGRSLHTEANPLRIEGTSSLLNSFEVCHDPWMSDLRMPTFDGAEVAGDINAQVELLETMIHTGVALIKNVGPPESLERERVGLRMEELVSKIIGKMNQHPVRNTRYFVIQKSAGVSQGADYDMQNPLSMHTDHTVYHGTPGFLQFMYQAEGSCQSKVCDGVALAEHMREHHPKDFELLSTVAITHSSRNNLYTPNGAPRDVSDPHAQGSPFELVHTHPIIQLDSNGKIEKVAQSETKRGVCALPFDEYESFMKAYKRWISLCEDQRFMKHFNWPEHSMVVMNNWQILHGRASVPPEMARVMVGGYVTKTVFENRYRLLKQKQTELANPSLTPTWLTRLPNQILAKMISFA
jgi:alpha-ketoglutarate-dependent taurine dioxygenase